MGRRRRKIKPARMIWLIIMIFLLTSVTVFISRQLSDTRPPIAGELVIVENASTDGYKTISKSKADIYSGELVLVNGDIPYQFAEADDLVSIYEIKNYSYKVKDKNVLLNRSAADALNDMLSDFGDIMDSNSVIVVSGHRTYDYQADLYDKKVLEDGEVEAMKWVAKAGSSEHHTGYALDFGLYDDNGRSSEYTGSGKYKWINDNAYKYGYIVRYPDAKKDITKISYEPWHFRYIGQPHAFIAAKNNMCLEEYIDYIRQFEFGKRHLLVTDFTGKKYEVYYTDHLEVPVPSDKAYRISGNNVDGFIVTVDLQQ